MQRDDYPSFIDWWIENQEEAEGAAVGRGRDLNPRLL